MLGGVPVHTSVGDALQIESHPERADTNVLLHPCTVEYMASSQNFEALSFRRREVCNISICDSDAGGVGMSEYRSPTYKYRNMHLKYPFECSLPFKAEEALLPP